MSPRNAKPDRALTVTGLSTDVFAPAWHVLQLIDDTADLLGLFEEKTNVLPLRRTILTASLSEVV